MHSASNSETDQGPVEALLASAADSRLSVLSYDAEALVLHVDVDIAGGHRAAIHIRKPVHVDLPPAAMLETVEISDTQLLPEGYLHVRDEGGDISSDEHPLFVTKFADQDGSIFFVLSRESPTGEWA
jgi:hypothetical protein